MPSWTLEQARQMLQSYLDAEVAVTTGQSYRIGSRELRRADLSEIAKQRDFWSKEVARLERGRGSGARVMRIVPRDL